MTELYQSQRAMRNMRQAAMQRGVIAILDVGSSKIACLVLRFDGPGRMGHNDGVGSLAGQSSFRVIGAATTPYVLAAEFALLTGRDPVRDPLVEKHIASLLDLFFPEP